MRILDFRLTTVRDYRKPMGTSTPPKQKLAVTSVKIERDKLDSFKRVAALNRRSMSQELRWVIDQHVALHEKQAA